MRRPAQATLNRGLPLNLAQTIPTLGRIQDIRVRPLLCRQIRQRRRALRGLIGEVRPLDVPQESTMLKYSYDLSGNVAAQAVASVSPPQLIGQPAGWWLNPARSRAFLW